ncbi:hypothetical protein Efla_005554 [Eimeria flavescens]
MAAARCCAARGICLTAASSVKSAAAAAAAAGVSINSRAFEGQHAQRMRLQGSSSRQQNVFSSFAPPCVLQRMHTAAAAAAAVAAPAAASAAAAAAAASCRFSTAAAAGEASCALTLEEPQRLALESVALTLQQQQQRQQQQRQQAELEALIPPAVAAALCRFLAVRNDVQAWRALLLEQQQQQQENTSSSSVVEADEQMAELQQEEEALAAELSSLLLLHAEEIAAAAAAAAEGHSPSRKKLNNAQKPTEEAMLEILAGVGGEEAGSFASELFEMYAAFAEQQGWGFAVLEKHKSQEGNGIRSARAIVSGEGVLSLLPLEAGVHRVQRVPATDAKRRMQTSTAAVTVLPCLSEAEVDMSPSKLRIECMRASGPGGQSVNKSETAVRVTHIPTGLSVCMQETSSQTDNRQRALLLLRHMLQQRMQQQQQQLLHAAAGAQMGRKDRSEKIRTYNFQADFVKDQRSARQVSNVRAFLEQADGLLPLLTELFNRQQQNKLRDTTAALQRLAQIR